jgi:hypothetical protein
LPFHPLSLASLCLLCHSIPLQSISDGSFVNLSFLRNVLKVQCSSVSVVVLQISKKFLESSFPCPESLDDIPSPRYIYMFYIDITTLNLHVFIASS